MNYNDLKKSYTRINELQNKIYKFIKKEYPSYLGNQSSENDMKCTIKNAPNINGGMKFKLDFYYGIFYVTSSRISYMDEFERNNTILLEYDGYEELVKIIDKELA